MIQRKTILCNRSADGAGVQAVLMSIFRTLRLRGHDPTPTIAAALRELISTGKLPAAARARRCRRVKCYHYWLGRPPTARAA